MTVTQMMTFGPSSIVERYTLSHEDCTEADNSQTFTLRTLPPGTIVKGVRIHQTEGFDIAATGATATCAVGSGAGATNSFAAAYDVQAAASDTLAQLTSGWKAITMAQDTLTATIASNANVNTLVTGKVNIDVELLFMPALTGCGPAGNNITGTGGLG